MFVYEKCILKFYGLTAYYIVFLTHPPNREHAENPMPTPVDSVMMMFLMSLNNFGSTYEAFARTEHETVAKVLNHVFKSFAITKFESISTLYFE